jgi:NAD(P)-dependent dehydrogenase (short-subunit alcohol dehydrogenase family)
MYNLSDKTIIVTGGANGIGAEYIRALHAAGAVLAIADIDQTAGIALANEFAERCIFVYADVVDLESVQTAFSTVHDRFGRLDILVNNAGIYPHEAFEKIELDEWRRVMRVNLESVFICTKAALHLMKPVKKGKIINIVTNMIWMMVPNMAHYVAAKAGVLGFTRAIAYELGAYGITVNALAPGANMPLGEMSENDIRRMQQIVSFQAIKRPQFAQDLVGAMLFLCSEGADFMTGQAICVDGGLAVL